MRAFDIIGDVHGQFDKLVALLTHLGYNETDGAWRHHSRTAVFVGDLIDRGPKQLATIELVRSMVDAGSAQCIMGNHEFNAIAWATPDPANPGEFLRPHGKSGNQRQHQAFLSEVEGTPKHDEIIAWFMTLPLWLDLSGLRVVHACWHAASIDRLSQLMGPNQTLTDELILSGSRKEHWVYQAIETICKGPEVELPSGLSVQDKEGRVRTEVRVKWWADDLSTYRKAAIGPPNDMLMIPDAPMPGEWSTHPYEGPPVVFGHYWFAGTPQIISPRFACVDYSAAHDGPLVAYRWDGEAELKSEKLAWIDDWHAANEKIGFDELVKHVAQPEQCVDCENQLAGQDFGRQWHLCKFCGEAVCKSCATSHYCEKQRSMNPHKRR
jgi:Calcineurin-like phosphoesterase